MKLREFERCVAGALPKTASVHASMRDHLSGCSDKNTGSENRKPQAWQLGVLLKLFAANKQENLDKGSSLAAATSSGNPLMTGCKMLNGTATSALRARAAVAPAGGWYEIS